MKQNKLNCDLKSCSFCKGCLPEWLPAIEASRKTYNLKKGELLFKEGEEMKGIYFLVAGKAKVHKRWGHEKELIVRIAGQGDIVGHRGLGKETNYPISATAIEPVTACFIPTSFFISSLKVNHDFAFALLLFYTEELKESEKNMRNMAHMPVKGRMAYALMKLYKRFGVTQDGLLNISLSRQDLASLAGTTYETCFKVMNDFVEEKYIELHGKEIKLLAIDELISYTTEL